MKNIQTSMLFVITALFAHGLLLVNDGNYADGGFLSFYTDKGDLEPYLFMLRESGAPLWAWFHDATRSTMSNYKFWMFCDILIIAALVYFILEYITPLKKNHRLFVAFFMLVWPAFTVAVDTTFAPVFHVIAAFYLGWWVFLFQKSRGGNRVWALVAYALMFVSFTYHSCLVYQYGLLGIYFLHLNGYPLDLKSAEWKARLREFINAHAVLIVLPLLYWGCRHLFWKPYGSKANYNKIQIFDIQAFEHYFKHLSHMAWDFFNAFFRMEWPAQWLFIVMGVVVLGIFIKRVPGKPVFEVQNYNQGAIVFGLLMVCFLAVPYGLVGKSFNLFNLEVRHALLAGPAIAIVWVGGVGWFLTGKGKRWTRCENLIFCQVILYLIVIDVHLYSSWQARHVKDMAVAAQLKKQTPLENVSLYLIRDNMPRGPHAYITSEANLLLYKGWGKENYFGIVSRETDRIVLRKIMRGVIVNWSMGKDWYKGASTGFNPGGCVGELIIHPKQEKLEMKTMARYLYLKYFDPGTLSAFYDSLVTVEMNPMGMNTWGQPCSTASRNLAKVF